MARPELPPIHLKELVEAGIGLYADCPMTGCRRSVLLQAECLPLPGDVTMKDVARVLRCTGCGRRGGISVYPVPRDWVRHLRMTGQRHREPWYAPMFSDGLRPEA